MRYIATVVLTFICCHFPSDVSGQPRSKSYDNAEGYGGNQSVRPAFDLIQSSALAAEIVNRAANAGGGMERLKNLKAISLDYEGDASATFQGLNPRDPHRRLPRTGNLTFDIAGNRLITFNETKWPNFSSVTNSLYREGKTYVIDDRSKTFQASAQDEVYRAWMLRLPPLLVKHLSENPTALRFEGRHTINGRAFNVVSSTLKGNKIYRFYFSQASGMPEMIEHLAYSSDFGDLTVRTVFSGFRPVDGMLIPAEAKTFNNGHSISVHTFKNVVLNEKVKLDSIAIPKEFQPAAANSSPPKMQTRMIAENVYLIENLAGRDYNVMFADLGEFLIVFEAPIDMWASKIALAEIRKIFPDKPTRYVMVSHFHDDHAAGIRNYMAGGATVITTPGNKDYFDRVARLKHTFHAENNLLHVAEPGFEIVRNGFHQIKGAAISVQFLDLGPTPHVDENIVAYIPERGIIFQGDFFRVPTDRSRPERIRDEGMIFLQKIKEKALVIKQLVGAHGQIGDVSDLEKALVVRTEKEPN